MILAAATVWCNRTHQRIHAWAGVKHSLIMRNNRAIEYLLRGAFPRGIGSKSAGGGYIVRRNAGIKRQAHNDSSASPQNGTHSSTYTRGYLAG